jgi:hypothetical protein
MLYFDLELGLGWFARLGYAVGLKWSIGFSRFFANVEAADILYGGGGLGRCL